MLQTGNVYSTHHRFVTEAPVRANTHIMNLIMLPHSHALCGWICIAGKNCRFFVFPRTPRLHPMCSGPWKNTTTEKQVRRNRTTEKPRELNNRKSKEKRENTTTTTTMTTTMNTLSWAVHAAPHSFHHCSNVAREKFEHNWAILTENSNNTMRAARQQLKWM